MRYAIHILLLGVLGPYLSAGAETPSPAPETDPVSRFIKDIGISIRRSAKDKNALPDPAVLQFTSPREGDDAYGIDVGVTWEVSDYLKDHGVPDSLDFGLFSEYHKNNQVSSKKENFKAGGLALLDVGNVAEDAVWTTLGLRANYRDDKQSTGSGYEFAFDVTPFLSFRKPGAPDYWQPNIGGLFGSRKYVEFFAQPVLSIQYVGGEDIMKSKNRGDTFQAGTVIQTAIFPFPEALDNRVELSGRFGFWQRFGQSGHYKAVDDGDNYIRAGATYHFGKVEDLTTGARSHPVSIGIDYVKGDDPVEGFRGEDKWSVSLKIKY